MRILVTGGATAACSVLGHDAWVRLAVPPIGEWRTAVHRAFPELLAARRAAAAAGAPAGLRGPRAAAQRRRPPCQALLSAITSRTAPLTHVTYFAWPGGRPRSAHPG